MVRVGIASRALADGARVLLPGCFETQVRRRFVAAARTLLCGAILAGCSPGAAERDASGLGPARNVLPHRVISRASILLPDRALLEAQPEPKCEYKGTGAKTDPGKDDPVRTKLDFERQCYRHAEIIVRQRLRLLQDSVNETIKAVRRAEQAAR